MAQFLLHVAVATAFSTFAIAAEPDRKLALVEGRFGKALDAKSTPASIDGSDRYRRPPLTVECWAKLNSSEHFNVLVSSDPKQSGRHWEIYSYTGSGAFSVYLPGHEPAEIRSKTNVVDGKWHYLAMTFDGKSAMLFVDGQKVHEQNVKSRNAKAVDGPLCFGQAIAADHRVGCDGLIDEVRISNVIREIDGIPAKELPQDPATVGLWRFDSDEGLKGDPAWTPPASLEGNAEPWEKFTDKDWIDPRFREMDTGRFLGATFAYPTWQGSAKAFKGIAMKIGDKNEGGVIFDRNQLRLAVGWTGDWLKHSDRRFGLLNTPSPAGNVVVATSSRPAWAYPREALAIPAAPATAPLPKEWGRYNGLYRHGNRTVLAYQIGDADVLEAPWIEGKGELSLLTRTLQVSPWKMPLRLLAADFPATPKEENIDGLKVAAARHNGVWHVVALVAAKEHGDLQVTGKSVEVSLPANGESRYLKLFTGTTRAENLNDVVKLIKQSTPPDAIFGLTKPGPTRWNLEVTTRGEVGKDDGPFAIDTLTIPYDNAYKALFFVTGVDFLPDGTIAICTAHGDVWLVKGADAKLEKLTWKRFATGLYQPMGLKVVDGKIHVIERGQLTRLHDLNNDGEADYYENLNNAWHCSGGEHSYDLSLETDPDGNFYFHKTGDHDTPTGGCLMKIAKDGSKAEIVATGFRHPLGLGASPKGWITGADQEGNWMPATRIDVYKQGGFYGDMRTHHRTPAPRTYDPPLLWLPREADNSAGGQVWVPEKTWGPLAGSMLHFSYGRCRMLLVMPQQIGDTLQAAAVDCGLKFLSGSARGRFHPNDGHLYVVGLNGWQTGAQRDGSLQRVRRTGQPLRMPIDVTVAKDGIRIRFAEALDRKAAEAISSWQIEQWNYRWRGEYGSRHWSVSDPTNIGHDAVRIESIALDDDGKGVFLKVPNLQPVMQMKITYVLKGADGAKVEGKIFNTIHALGK